MVSGRNIMTMERKTRMKKTPVIIRRKFGWDKGPVLTNETEYKVEPVQSRRRPLRRRPIEHIRKR